MGSSSNLVCLFVCVGVCLGMQLAVCEFARNELGWEGDVPTTVLWFVNVRKET